MAFELSKNVYEVVDADGVPRHLRHLQEPYIGNGAAVDAHDLAHQYLLDVQAIYKINAFGLALGQPPSNTITNDGTQIRYAGTESFMGIDTVSFVQTHFGLPIWEAGLSVTVHDDPLRVTSSISTVHQNIGRITKPSRLAAYMPDGITEAVFRTLLGPNVASDPELGRSLNKLTLHGTRLLVCQFDASGRPSGANLIEQIPPGLPLPDLPANFRAGTHYVVSEVLFTLALPSFGDLNWRAFVEVETGTIVYLEAFVSSLVGSLFRIDPPTRSGDTSITVDSQNADLLNEWTERITLPGLPENEQVLEGEYVKVTDITKPHIATTRLTPAGDFIFDPDAEVNDFSAVNAYYSCDDAFRLVEDVGFDVKKYFAHTVFPVSVDPQASIPSKATACTFGDCANASTSGNSNGNGVEGFQFARLDPNHLLSCAVAKRAVLHEFGHALLYNKISKPNLKFSHSVGDSLAAIHCDPGTQLKDRFATFPWISACLGAVVRRHDRSIASGWGWGGSEDDHGYKSEQILSTTLFRAYLAAGGEATNSAPTVQFARHQYAARFLIRLIVQALKNAPSNANTPIDSPNAFATALMDADAALGGFDGRASGTFHKVIDWSFRKQGLDSAIAANPLGEGLPSVDLYIDDGRNGEYMYQENFWNSRQIWNRVKTGAKLAHETPVPGQVNYVYVRVKNRGVNDATNATVSLYHLPSAAGLVWPQDRTSIAMTPGSIKLPLVAAGASEVVGPFEWTPIKGTQEALLATVTVAGDLSNVDPTTIWPCAAGPTPLCQLVPFDNNIALRNIVPLPGGGGKKPLVDACKGLKFHVMNPFSANAHVTIEASLPSYLTERGWYLQISKANRSFNLKPSASRAIPLKLVAGTAFTPQEITDLGIRSSIECRAIVDGQIIGGTTYEIDPDMTAPAP